MPFVNALYEPDQNEETRIAAWRLLESGRFPTLMSSVPVREVFAFAVALKEATAPKRKGRRRAASSADAAQE